MPRYLPSDSLPVRSLEKPVQQANAIVLILAVMLALMAGPARADDTLKHEWCVYSTSHFDVTTDLPNKDALNLISHLENFDTVVRAADIPYLGTPENPAKLLIFAKRRDFSRITKAKFYAGYTQPSLMETRIVLGPNYGGRYLATTSLHEYTHFLMRNLPIYFPVWFEEGYASYLSSMAFGDNEVILGGIPEDRGPGIPQRPYVKLQKILETGSIDDLGSQSASRFYARAWLLTHYLTTGYRLGLPDHREHLSQYLVLLNRGIPVDQAFEGAFHSSINTLSTELRRYSRLSQLPRRRLTTLLPDPPAPERNCLDGRAIRMLLAQAVTYRNPAYAEKLYRSVLEVDTENIDALTGLSTALAEQQQLKQAALLALETYETGREREQTAVQLANMLIRRCRNEQDDLCSSRWSQALKLYREAIQIDPERMDAVYGIGVGRLYQGLPGEALNYFRVAYRKAPWSPILNYYLGECYARIGKFARARVHLERALNWAASPYVEEAAGHALSELPD